MTETENDGRERQGIVNYPRFIGLVIVFAVVLSAGVMGTGAIGEADASPSADLDAELDDSGDCWVKGSVDPATADRVIVEVGSVEHMVDRPTSVVLGGDVPGNVTVFGVHFPETYASVSDRGKVEVLLEAQISEECEFKELIDDD